MTELKYKDGKPVIEKYTSELAAECHAMRDLLDGKVGYSYGFEFSPHVKHHPKTHKDHEYWEVYTG